MNQLTKLLKIQESSKSTKLLKIPDCIPVCLFVPCVQRADRTDCSRGRKWSPPFKVHRTFSVSWTQKQILHLLTDRGNQIRVLPPRHGLSSRRWSQDSQVQVRPQIFRVYFSPDSSDMSFRFRVHRRLGLVSGQFSCCKRLNSVLGVDAPVAPSLIRTPSKHCELRFNIQHNTLNPPARKHRHFSIYSWVEASGGFSASDVIFTPAGNFRKKNNFYLSHFM